MLDKVDWVMEDLNYQWMGSRLYPLGNVEPLTHTEEQHTLRIIYWAGMLGERMEEAERPDRRLLK